MTMRETISLDEMRERVARLIFGDDWIGGLTDDQHQLLKQYAPEPKAVVRTDKSVAHLNHVAKCPAGLSDKLDQAMGRLMRRDAQYVTVDSWIQDRGFPVDPRVDGDRKAFNKAVRDYQNDAPAAAPSRGRKAKVQPRVEQDMRDDLNSGKLTRDRLASMLEKEMEDRYRASRDTVRKARTAVLKFTSRQKPTKKK
jgi:hypothetical protein